MVIANKQHLSSFESVLFSAEEVGSCKLNRIWNICSGDVGCKGQERIIKVSHKRVGS